jgi:hypothetical protein
MSGAGGGTAAAVGTVRERMLEKHIETLQDAMRAPATLEPLEKIWLRIFEKHTDHVEGQLAADTAVEGVRKLRVPPMSKPLLTAAEIEAMVDLKPKNCVSGR